MKRVGLRIALAEAIDDALWNSGYSLTLDNAKNHVSNSMLRNYRIRVSQQLYDADWLVALHLVREDRRERHNRLNSERLNPRADRMKGLVKTLFDAHGHIIAFSDTHPR
jgi:hypothetical protein